jgi:alkylhydroperoxidase family enzyme
VSDALYAQARQHFDEEALVDLTLLVVAINGWNRINIASRNLGGNYRPAKH